MIATRLMGGLGNQMFQYALARRLAHDHHTTPVMDMVFFDTIAESDTPRQYELDCFAVQKHVLRPSQRPPEDEARYLGKRGKLRLISDRLAGRAWTIYREKHHHFDPSALRVRDGAYLIGYWQTEKYFAPIRDILLKEFTVIDPPKGRNKVTLKQIQNTATSVSLHVRRGDYVSNVHANKFHGTKGQDYYDAALAALKKKGVTNPTIFVFSDDPQWCKKNLKFADTTVYVEGNKKGHEDMRLMQHCRHNIIANSSFSWWAAWLNQHPDKIVVAPKQWFNDPTANTKDVLPSSWLQV